MGVNAGKKIVAAAVVVAIVAASSLIALGPTSPRSQSDLIVDVTDTNHLKPTTEDPRLEHWLPDWYNQSDIGLLLNNRVKEIKKRCKGYNGRRNDWKDSPKKTFASSQNIVYCETAKAGSTFWKTLLKNSKSVQAEETGISPMKMTTMRNPWHRLVSTYIQKIETKKGESLDEHVEKFCWKPAKRKPSFKEFVKECIIRKWKKHNYNIHWLPTTERCDVCRGDFDFIVAVENMAQESNYVLEKAGLKNAEELFNDTRSDTIRTNEKQKKSANYQSYYIDMDIEDIQTLQRIYEFDIYVLQYPTTPFVDFEKS